MPQSEDNAEETVLTSLENEYGYLQIRSYNDSGEMKYAWGIEGQYATRWQVIPKSMFEEIKTFAERNERDEWVDLPEDDSY